VTVFGGSSLPWACRFEEYGRRASLLGVKANVKITSASKDPAKNAHLVELLEKLHKKTKFSCQGHFLVTTLWQTNATIHTVRCASTQSTAIVFNIPRPCQCSIPPSPHYLIRLRVPTATSATSQGISYGIWSDFDGKPLAEPPLFYQVPLASVRLRTPYPTALPFSFSLAHARGRLN